jgi:proton-dependent oligopeptide transporter, POT family
VSDTKINHPPSLKIFFATEMWERYGFYVVQTLLVLYLVMDFGWEDNRTYPLIGAFTALTYLSPVVGGWIADHLLGQKRSILLGAIILMVSYCTMSFFTGELGLFYALSGVAVGTGLLKPNISSLLGNEYPENSPKRERGFTIFYLGITSGIILGTTIPSYLQSEFGWPAAFFSAAVGMLFAIYIFSYEIHRYQTKDYSPGIYHSKHILKTALILAALFFGSFYILRHATLASMLFTVIGIFSVIYMLSAIWHESGDQARQTMVIGLLCLISVLFWTFYFQMFSSIMVFLKRVAQPSLFGFPFPPPYYVALQSLGMIVFGVFLSRKNTTKDLKKRTIQAGNKFILSMLFLCLAYGLLIISTSLPTGYALLTPLYFIPSYFVISLSELLLSPVGLASTTLLASHNKVSTMMGIFFLSLGMGGFLSGKLANLAAIPKQQLEHLNIMQLKSVYALSFRHMLYLLLAATLLSICINFFIKHLMTKKTNN